MKASTTSAKHKPWQIALAGFGWLAVWQIASALLGQEMLLASPIATGAQLCRLLRESFFWHSVGFSLSRVTAGFFLAFAVGTLLAAAAYKVKALAIFLSPFMSVVKASPVASYIILCLLLLPLQSLSVCISFLMSLPVVYTNVLQGLLSTDRKLLEMAAVFEIPAPKRILYIYLSELMPFLLSACSLSLGLCWKAGIAAEVIGLPLGSIGEQMYMAKIYVDTKTLLAWTVVVVAVSFLLERVFLFLLQKIEAVVERR